LRSALWNDAAIDQKPPERVREIEDAPIHEELAEVAADIRLVRRVGRAEVDKEKTLLGHSGMSGNRLGDFGGDLAKTGDAGTDAAGDVVSGDDGIAERDTVLAGTGEEEARVGGLEPLHCLFVAGISYVVLRDCMRNDAAMLERGRAGDAKDIAKIRQGGGDQFFGRLQGQIRIAATTEVRGNRDVSGRGAAAKNRRGKNSAQNAPLLRGGHEKAEARKRVAYIGAAEAENDGGDRGMDNFTKRREGVAGGIRSDERDIRQPMSRSGEQNRAVKTGGVARIAEITGKLDTPFPAIVADGEYGRVQLDRAAQFVFKPVWQVLEAVSERKFLRFSLWDFPGAPPRPPAEYLGANQRAMKLLRGVQPWKTVANR